MFSRPVLGQELAGAVESAGKDVGSLRKDDRVSSRRPLGRALLRARTVVLAAALPQLVVTSWCSPMWAVQTAIPATQQVGGPDLDGAAQNKRGPPAVMTTPHDPGGRRAAKPNV